MHARQRNKTMPLRRHVGAFEKLYRKYNHRRFVHPDPLEFLYRYEDPADREVVGLIAASLAFGNVKQILASVGGVLSRMTDHPGRYVFDASPAEMRARFADFVHRIWTGGHLAALLVGLRGAVRSYGSLRRCFGAFDGQETVVHALRGFVAELNSFGADKSGSLLPDPGKGSACKRLHLYLRWMVRQDRVDPGGWHTVSPAKLIVPLDTHMHRIGLALRATKRKSADITTAMEITEAFRQICPDDPVRYDFALTRLGIRDDADLGAFLGGCQAGGDDA